MERRVTMKRVLVFFLVVVMLVSLSLVVSCQKKEETGVSGEDLISDYTANDATEALVQSVQDWIES